MKKLLALLMFCSLFGTTFAQKEDVKLVVGIESSTIFRFLNEQLGKGLNYAYGLNVSVPIKQFSLGMALLHTNYGRKDAFEYTGESFIEEYRGNQYERYYFYDSRVRLNYITLSNRLQYRLPCNCAFLHVGYNFDFLSWISKDVAYDWLKSTSGKDYALDEQSNLKKINTGLEFGFGLKMHFNPTTFIVMRPTYHILQRPSKAKNEFFEENAHYLQMSFALKMGIR